MWQRQSLRRAGATAQQTDTSSRTSCICRLTQAAPQEPPCRIARRISDDRALSSAETRPVRTEDHEELG